MKRAYELLGSAALLVVLRLGLGAAGLAEHTSVIAGMPISQASWTMGPLYVLVHLAAEIVAPVLAIAAALEAAMVRLRDAPRSDRGPRAALRVR